jgi:hypothetical protein
MNWSLDNLTPKQALAIEEHGYVGAFCKVFLQRLLAMEPPKTEVPMSADTDEHPLNTPSTVE